MVLLQSVTPSNGSSLCVFRGVSARGGEDCRDTQRQHRFRGDDHELGVHLPPLTAHEHLFALPVPVPKMKKEDTPIDDSRAGVRPDAWCRSRADYASGGKRQCCAFIAHEL